MGKKKILLAGATGYLGRYIACQLLKQGYPSTLLVRDRQKANFDSARYNIAEAEITQAESLAGICKGIDTVISTVGITKQKDGLNYMEVDYQANVNLIEEAKKNGVKKFIYISVLNGQKLRSLKICEAKEKLADYLASSGLNFCIIRPNGFFSDMEEFLKMAKKGRVYLFGDGKQKLNPIHGKDLAEVCVNAIEQDVKEIDVGSPDLLTQNEIGELALKAHSKSIKILHLPDRLRKLSLWLLRTFTSPKVHGPVEFFLITMAMDMTAPKYGKIRLKDFFNRKAKE